MRSADLLTASGGGPVAFVFDDAHLADEATLDVLAHLGSPGGVQLLLVLAYRAESAPTGADAPDGPTRARRAA